MNRLGALRRMSGLFWTGLGVGIRALGQWAFVWLLIRWFGPEEVGRYGLATALVVPITAFFSLHMMRFQATDRGEEFSFGDYLNLRRITSLLALLVILGAAIFVPGNARPVVLVLALQSLVMNLIQVFEGRILQSGDSKGYGQVLTLVNVSVWVAAIAGLLLTRQMEIGIAVSAVAALLSLSLYLVPKVRQLEGESIDIKGFIVPRKPGMSEARLLRLTAPLGLGLLVDSAITQFPRLFLRSTAGDYELGILVGLLTFLSVGALAIESITQVATPVLSSWTHQRNFDRLRNTLIAGTGLIFGLSAVLAIGAYTLGPNLAGFILSDEYSAYPMALALIVLVFSLQFSFRLYMIVLTTARKVDSILWVNLASFGVVVAAGWLLIPRHGVNGAVLTVALSNVVRWFLIVAMFRNIPALWPSVRLDARKTTA